MSRRKVLSKEHHTPPISRRLCQEGGYPQNAPIWRSHARWRCMALRPQDARNRHYCCPPRFNFWLCFVSQATCSRELFLRLREGEKKKYCRDGKTDKKSGIFYSGGDIMSLIERDIIILAPTSITSHGHTGPLFNQLLYGHKTQPHGHFRDRPNGQIVEEYAWSANVPYMKHAR